MARTKGAAGSHGAKGKKRPRDNELRKTTEPCAVRKHRWHALTKRKFEAKKLVKQTNTLIRRRPFSRLLNVVATHYSPGASAMRMQRKARDAVHIFAEDVASQVLQSAVSVLKLVGNGQTLRPRHVHVAARQLFGPLPSCAEIYYMRLLQEPNAA